MTMKTRNQTPEQKARDNIESMFQQGGWKVQLKKKNDFNDGPDIAERKYDADVAHAD